MICPSCGAEAHASKVVPAYACDACGAVFRPRVTTDPSDEIRWNQLGKLAREGLLAGIVKSGNTLKTMRDLVINVQHTTIVGRGHYIFDLSERGKAVAAYGKRKLEIRT